ELLPNEPWAPAILPLLHAERRNGKAFAPGAAASLGDRAEAAALLEGELADRGREALLALEPITLAGFRDTLGVSRRVAQLLLERYDADGLTRRVGDERVLRASARQRT